MRIAGLCGLGLVALTTSSFAADMPTLRGSQAFAPAEPVYFRWQGVYFGGHAGYSTGSADLSQGTKDLVAYIMRNTMEEEQMNVSSWTTLPTHNGVSGAGWGGFIGYNAQWDDAVLGVELNYTRVNMQANASDSMSRYMMLTDGYYHAVSVSTNAGINLTDLGTARLRGGWAASWFMPYAFIGVAVGRADVTRSATVSERVSDANWNLLYTVAPQTASDNRTAAYAFGYTAGLGIDVAMTSNVFLRAEYEYVNFSDFQSLKLNVNTVRAGLGAKF
ncbi:MAG: porin family protein [Rhodoplanes sp.]|uniref:outer membrane protein n=1 Tax=Rhodoplanes sp. TaxID=1968906 RepID=UPI0017ADEA21|nr:outer membrane beta-barrel protein [Rhodoplanes sp.]NVO13029.1 porin family protein [Rhodoplanes sp.]